MAFSFSININISSSPIRVTTAYKAAVNGILFLVLIFQAAYVRAEGAPLFEIPQQLSAAKGLEIDKKLAKVLERKKEGSIRAVKVSLSALLGNVVNVPLADRKSLVLYKIKSEVSGKAQIWTGTTADKKAKATLAMVGSDLAGSIRYEGKIYDIEPLGDGYHAFSIINKSKTIYHTEEYLERESSQPVAPAFKSLGKDEQSRA